MRILIAMPGKTQIIDAKNIDFLEVTNVSKTKHRLSAVLKSRTVVTVCERSTMQACFAEADNYDAVYAVHSDNPEAVLTIELIEPKQKEPAADPEPVIEDPTN